MDNIFYRIIYSLLAISLFFQMIFINIIVFLLFLIFIGFKRFILEFHHLEDFYVKQFTVIIVFLSTSLSIFIFYIWKGDINGIRRQILIKSSIKFLIIFSCFLTWNIALFSFNLFLNSIVIFIIYIIDKDNFILDLNGHFHDVFNFWIDRL